MGTTYSIKYISHSSNQLISKESIDSTLLSINAAVSTYEVNSTISKLNKAGTEGITLKLNEYPGQHFITNYFSALEVYTKTEGLFDPSVMPLVNYWGFGYEGKNPVTTIDSSKVHQLLSFVGFDSFKASPSNSEMTFSKKDARATLDFSALAKGYAVDYLSQMLESKAIDSYMVEIGGEVKVNGKNAEGMHWKLGINTPDEKARFNDIQLIVNPKTKALASSGNYRIFHKIDDISYGHEINPKTGFPHRTNILSASVIHKNCMYADAYATAFMIMGLEETIQFANNDPEIAVCLIVKDNGELLNILSEGFDQYIVD